MANANKAHLDNFISDKAVRFAIVDVASDAVKGTTYWEVASGKTEAEATERFYNRFMFRLDIDREMMAHAQRRNSLVMQKIENNSRALIESGLTLIA